MLLKPFAAGDFDDYLALSREFYASDATDHPVPEDHFQRTFDETVGGSPIARGWLIRETAEGPVVGYMLASLAWSTEFGGRIAWLEELYLRQEARGRGLGRRVFEAVLEELKSKDGVVGFRLEVTPTNSAATIMYQNLGFTLVPYNEWWMTV